MQKMKLLFLCAVSLLMVFSLNAQAANNVQALFHQANDPVGGNRSGTITIVEFFDYQCSHCIDMAKIITAIIYANPDVRVVYKEFPIRGPVSEFASRAALAANKQGKYAEFNHALLTTQLSLSEQTILDIAKATGLNLPKLQLQMKQPMINTQLKNNMKLAQALKLTGTPAFFIGKTNAKSEQEIRFFLGAMSQSEMQAAIDQAKTAT